MTLELFYFSGASNVMIPQQEVYSVSDRTDGRIIRWLCLYLNIYHRIDIGFYNSQNFIDKLNSVLYRFPKQEIEKQLESCFLDINNYSWITNDRNQLNWIINNFSKENLFTDGLYYLFENDKNFVIGLFDSCFHEDFIKKNNNLKHMYYEKSQEYRILLNNKLQEEWLLHSESERVLEWMNSNEEPGRLKAAWQVLRKLYPEALGTYAGPENLQYIKEFFNINNLGIPYIVLFLEQVKRKHSQNKSKEKTKHTKKQCNILLSTDAIKRLNHLKNKYEISQAAVIEILLLKEVENKMYITERLRQTKVDNVSIDKGVVNSMGPFG